MTTAKVVTALGAARANECNRIKFEPVRISVTEFLRPKRGREGERVLWPDGSVRGYPPPGTTEVTVLRRR